MNQVQKAVWYIKHNYNAKTISDQEIQDVADYYECSWVLVADKL